MASVRLIGIALLLVVAAAQAQAPTRVRGTISALDGNVLAIRDAKSANLQVMLGQDTEILLVRPITLDEIKPGDFLAITSLKRPDGTLSAFEVRRFPKPLNPGHGPFEGRDDQTMTNATVDAMVQSASGRELTMTYTGGTQKITLPQNASISDSVPGQRSLLVPGAMVNLSAAPGPDGRLVARRLQVSPKQP